MLDDSTMLTTLREAIECLEGLSRGQSIPRRLRGLSGTSCNPKK